MNFPTPLVRKPKVSRETLIFSVCPSLKRGGAMIESIKSQISQANPWKQVKFTANTPVSYRQNCFLTVYLANALFDFQNTGVDSRCFMI